MTILRFSSKEQFENFVNKESKAKEPQQAPASVPALTAEQVSKNTNEFMRQFLEKERAAIIAARKSATPKPQPQPQYTGRRPVVRCVECKHLSKDRQCVANGWEPSHPDRTRLCWDYSPLLG